MKEDINMEGILYWITGLSGAGKTTIGNRLYYEIKKHNKNVVILDGDILKKIVDEQPNYGVDDRRKRAIKYAQLCKTLTDQGLIVICCTIAMFDEVREWNRRNNRGYVEVFIKAPLKTLKQRDQRGMYSKYTKGNFKNLVGIDLKLEFPKNPDIVLKNDGKTPIEELVKRIMEYSVELSVNYKRDTVYWDSYYLSNKGDITPSLFATEVGKLIKKNKSILELGCGNGRDSLYFDKLGLQVTAIDASNATIEKLKNKKTAVWFVCDDFVNANIIKTSQFDYIYSRFTLHAINEQQENELLYNVFDALKINGKFFVESRSTSDEKYGQGKKIGENEYILDDHYRRFIDKDKLVKKLSDIGFFIEYCEEKRGFAPTDNCDPVILRLICSKEGNKYSAL